ncbi:MAG: carbohydrate ABC transporter permease [Lachnospiraceae bacterium]|uniref:carbohydrate ABC transporter permease n=1 Tax=Parablautia sp. Marseille-Q6255 TaxID=3039593 RepID=UPI0024BD1540|nr:sugar ABC transporter permease [Parablautia sp. Marseille-Q6255]
MKKRVTLEKKRERAGLLFVAPSMIIFTVFVFVPLIIAVVFSFLKFDMMFNHIEFQKFDHYIKLVQDKRFWNALFNTLYYTVFSVPLLIGLALGAAVLVKRKGWFSSICKSVFFLPAICSMTVVSIVWSFLVNPDVGMFSYWLTLFGFEPVNVLNSPTLAMPAVILVGVWKNFGFNMVILLAGLNGIDESYYEAAKLDGATSWQQFKRITVPMLMPTLSFTIVNAIIGSFQVFDQVYVMTKGGPLFKTQTLVQLIYSTAFDSFNMGYASAIAVALFLITFVASVLTFKRMTKGEEDLA